MIDVRKIKTGKDIAQLMRESKSSWANGTLARGSSRCAMGMVAHAAGISNEIMRELGQCPKGMTDIVSVNDLSHSKKGAIEAIENYCGDKDFSKPLHEWLTELCKLQKAADAEAAKVSKVKVSK